MRKPLLAATIVALALGACGGRRNPDIQPAAPQPEPMAPGDPVVLPTGEPGTQFPDAGLPPIAPGTPLVPEAGEGQTRPPTTTIP